MDLISGFFMRMVTGTALLRGFNYREPLTVNTRFDANAADSRFGGYKNRNCQP